MIVWYYPPIYGFLILGVGLGLSYSSIWTGVIFVISPENYGKGFGCIVAFYNVGFTIIPLFVGVIRRLFYNTI